MMHHYGYSIKRGVLPFIRGTWYRLSTAIRCNIENGYAALTLLTMKTWRHLTVEKQIKQHADTWLKEKYGMLTFDDYQTSAKGTAIYPRQYRLIYPALGLAGEAGEVANKIKKIVRDGEVMMPPDWKEQVASEIGDVLWYCAALASDLDIPLSKIAGQNKTKLENRQKNNTLQGSGDNR